MRTSNVVLDIADREVDRMKVVLSGGNGNRRFVRPQDDRHEHGTVGRWVLSDDVLMEGFIKWEEKPNTEDPQTAATTNHRTSCFHTVVSHRWIPGMPRSRCGRRSPYVPTYS